MDNWIQKTDVWETGLGSHCHRESRSDSDSTSVVPGEEAWWLGLSLMIS